jgi:phenylpropionate dioxygenase-like ring-hydroxylating dioxygenase large terminal subunit
MVTIEENELLTRIGPGTPGGELMRRYWQPAALSEQLPVGGAPIPVHLLGEELVLFRDSEDRPGLLGLHCSHRGADLSYGRLEDGGLRCIYHGWLYDRTGRCLEQPGEPEGSKFHERIRHLAYPCQELGGVIFAYLGPGEAPLLPAYDFLTAPAEHRFVTKLFQDCNYLQGNEGNQDPVHLSFLHRVNFAERSNALMAGDVAPQIDLEITDWGVRIYAIRRAGPDQRYVRITNTVLPNFTCFRGSEGENSGGYSVNWHVPIDDTHHWKYTFMWRRNTPINKDEMGRGRADQLPDYHMVRNKANRYLQDREEMRTKSFLGMGMAFQVHDTCVTEGAGPIQDRTAEHLTRGDICIVTARQVLMKAIKDVQEGRDPPHVVRRPADNRFPDLVVDSGLIPDSLDHRVFWKPEARELVAPVG